MGAKGMVALGAAAIALLAGPGTAWAQEDGTAGDSTLATADPAVTSEQDPGTTEGTIDTSTAPAEPSATETDSATDSPVVDVASSEVTTDSQPQVEAEAASVDTSSNVNHEWGAKSTASKAIKCATKAAAPAAGCTRIDGGQVAGVHQVVVNGVTITFTFTVTDNGQGPVLTWTSDVPFTGTIYVKGGPEAITPTACTYVNATSDTSGNCHPPLNTNNGKWYGLSHIDICPAGAPPPTTTTPPGGGGPGAQGVAGKEKKGKQGTKGKEAQGTSPAVASAAAAAVTGEQLPFTGLNALWLVLFGVALLGSGTILRARRG